MHFQGEPTMKNLIRVFVVSLVATGAYASVQTPSSTKTVVAPTPSALPMPTCDPGTGCTMCGFGARC